MFGVEGGNGVLLVRDEKTGTWSEPAFYELSSASFGLQAGAEKSESILVIQRIKGIDSLLSSTIKLGADVSAAVGPQGGGMEGATPRIWARISSPTPAPRVRLPECRSMGPPYEREMI